MCGEREACLAVDGAKHVAGQIKDGLSDGHAQPEPLGCVEVAVDQPLGPIGPTVRTLQGWRGQGGEGGGGDMRRTEMRWRRWQTCQ